MQLGMERTTLNLTRLYDDLNAGLMLCRGVPFASFGGVSGHKNSPNDSKKIIDLRNHSDPYVTTTDLADYWRVSRKQIYKQIDAGTLNAIRLGPRLLRISTSEAARFEESAKMAPPDDHERIAGRSDRDEPRRAEHGPASRSDVDGRPGHGRNGR
jgi:excisionase family DNA binding protein